MMIQMEVDVNDQLKKLLNEKLEPNPIVPTTTWLDKWPKYFQPYDTLGDLKATTIKKKMMGILEGTNFVDVTKHTNVICTLIS